MTLEMIWEKKEQMIESVAIDNKKIILVGTAHVSQSSVDEVAAVIRDMNPDSVAIELCENRYRKMEGKDDGFENLDIESVLRKGQGMLMIVNFFLSSYQKKIGESLGVKPGAEMAKAIEVAKEEDKTIVLADRDVTTTLKRVLGHLKFWEKIKGLYRILIIYFTEEEDENAPESIDEAAIEALKNQETIADSLKQLEGIFPSVKTYLVDERDEYLAYKIRKSPGETVVAVIGAAHLEGVKKHILANDVTAERIQEITQIPKKKRTGSWIGLGLLVLFLILIGATFMANPTVGASNIGLWVLLTCSLGGLGALLAGGHPLTILAAIIGSPIGAALPFLASGMISGLVEAKVRKPQVKDFKGLNNAIFTFKGWWNNKILKIFTVFFLTSLGSAIGNIIGLKGILDGFFGVF